MKRLTPLRIWGPTGPTPEFGTKYALDMMQKMYAWDIAMEALRAH
jgi:ribonuclease Z